MSNSIVPLEAVSTDTNTGNESLKYSSEQKQAVLSSTQSSEILTFDQFRASYAETPRMREGYKSIELLYRDNVLWARATLFKHCVSRSELMDYAKPGVIDSIRNDIGNYNRAVDEFRTFRASSSVLFKDNEILMQVGEFMSYLEAKKEDIASFGPDEAVAARQQLSVAEQSLYRYYAYNILPDHEAGVSLEIEKTAKRGLYARLAMALGGGLALIVPMLIMVLHPTQLKSLVVTCVFVIAVAVGLAVFMDTAETKDIIASVAGYAAVLVVFVGLNVPTPSPM